MAFGIENAMKSKVSAADLTAKDIWGLIKHAMTAILVCAFIFVIPYLLFSGAERALEGSTARDATKWIGAAVWVLVLYFIISNLSEVSESLSRFFNNIAKGTRGMPFLKKAILVALCSLFLYGWRAYPEVTFFVWVLVIIPAGLTYDRYTELLNKK